MFHTLSNRLTNQRGYVLVATLILTTLSFVLATALVQVSQTETKLRGGASTALNGFYAAEAGLSVGMAEFKNTFDAYGIPEGTDFAQQTFTLNNRTVVYDADPVPGTCSDVTSTDCYTTILLPSRLPD